MFNLDIINYCFKGVHSGSDRYIMATLKNTLLDNGVSVTHSFDSPSYYGIFRGFDKYQTFNDYDHTRGRTIVSPEEFLNIFLGKKVDVNWFNNLQVGSTVKIGWCSKNIDGYSFDFDQRYVWENFHKEVTIDNIVMSLTDPSRLYPRWHNNDYRCYHIAEFDHYLPSSVFIPQFEPLKPIKEISLSEISLNFLKVNL